MALRGIALATPLPNNSPQFADLAISANALGGEDAVKRAAAILFQPGNSAEVRVRHLWSPLPGVEPQIKEFNGPLIVDIQAIGRLIAEHADREIERVQFADGQEVAIPRFPASAIDEVIVNALIHRDWRVGAPVVITQTPRVLKVWSPGPLPEGVKANRLLTGQSQPRNNRLMAAMRTLGLAEEASRGFDRMWAAMLRTGRDVPEVIAGENSVEVILSAGQPDVQFIQGIAKLADACGETLINNVYSLIVLWHLWKAPVITGPVAVEAMQASRVEVDELLAALVDAGVLELVRDAREWVLSSRARILMGLGQDSALAAMSVQDWVESQFAAGRSLSSAEIRTATGISQAEATELLRHLRTLGRAIVDPSGPPRGRGTRWIRPGR